jgi:predicted DNA-binding transcriptional regulator AlpA
MNANKENWLTLKKAAAYMGVSKETVYRLLHKKGFSKTQAWENLAI